MHADTCGARDGGDVVDLGERPDAPSRDVVGVLEHEHGRPLVDVVHHRRGRLAHLSGRQPACTAREADREETGVHGGAAELVDDDVGVLLGDEHVARAAV